MRRFTSVFTLLLLAFVCGLMATPTPLRAQEDNKALLAHKLHMDHEGFESAADASVVVEKLFVLNFPPDVWEAVLSGNAENDSPRHHLSNLACGLAHVANDMGLGDLSRFGGDPKNPLRVSTVDEWKGKVNFTIDIPAGLDAKASAQAWKNISLLQAPMENDYYNKPRSGKFLLHVTIDPKAPKMRFNLSKDATTFHFVLPAYVDISQGDVETYLAQGK